MNWSNMRELGLTRIRAIARQAAYGAADPEDLAAETARRVCVARRTPGLDLGGLAWRIALNLAHDHNKHARFTAGPDVADRPVDVKAFTEPGADVEIERQRLAGAVSAALEAVRPARRWVFEEVVLDGRSYAEAATRTGLPMGTVRSRVARARADVLIALARAGYAEVAA